MDYFEKEFKKKEPNGDAIAEEKYESAGVLWQ